MYILFFKQVLNKVDIDTILFDGKVISNICISLSRFLTVIPYIILTIKTRRKTKRIGKDKNKEKSYEYNDKIKESAKGKWGYILLSSFIFLILSYFLNESFKIKTNAWIWYILFSSLFYYLIFKIKLYIHHYLSIVLIILLGLAIDLITKNLQNEIVEEPSKLLMKFNVIAKYVMEQKYVSVYEFSFYVGLFNLIVLLIFSIFDYYFLKWTPFEKFFNNYNKKQLLLLLGIVFSQLGINITTLLTTKNNSPCHIFIIFVFGQIAYYIDFSGISTVVIILLINNCIFIINI